MTEHVTIELSAEQLKLARREAERLGVSVEAYLSRVVEGGLPRGTGLSGNGAMDIAAIFGIGASAEPTDIARDKDRLVAEAVCKEHLRKTRVSE